MSMFNDNSWRSPDNEKERESSAQFVSIDAKRFSPGRWSFFGLASEKRCIAHTKTNHKENGIELRSK